MIMKTVYLLPFVLVGCATIEPPPKAEIPVYEKPKFEMPIRPVMRSDGNKTDGETVRELHKDVIDLKDYALQLENILTTLK